MTLHAFGRIHAGQIDDRDDLERCHRIAIRGARDAGLNFRSWNWPRVKLVTSSDSEPLRMTRICSGSPLEESVLRRPLTSASMASSTATVSAMPSAVMSVVVLRTTRLRRLYATGMAMGDS